MTKGEFIEFIQHNLSGGASVQDKESKFSIEVIEVAVGIILQDLASMDVRPGAVNIMNWLISKSKTAVVLDDNGRKYFMAPMEGLAGPNSLKHVGLEVGSPSFSIHSSYPAMSMMSELKGESMRTGVYPSNNRWYFTKNVLFDSVYVTMVPSFREYDDTDEFVAGDQYFQLYARVEEMFSGVYGRLVDQQNDNAVKDERNSG